MFSAVALSVLGFLQFAYFPNMSDLQAAIPEVTEVDESKRMAVAFLEKEIKTYIALALFFSKEGFKENMLVGNTRTTINANYYKDRMREARKLVTELRKPI